jgi:hypothetical protein
MHAYTTERYLSVIVICAPRSLLHAHDPASPRFLSLYCSNSRVYVKEPVCFTHLAGVVPNVLNLPEGSQMEASLLLWMRGMGNLVLSEVVSPLL